MKALQSLVLCLALLCGAAALGAQTPQWQWAVKAGGIDGDEGQSIAIDGNGNQYIIGCFDEIATFGNHTLTTGGGKDIFVAKLDSSGNWLWAIQAGGTDRDYGIDITLDGQGNAWVTGHFEGTASFGSHTLTANGEYDVFAAKLDSSGNWLWAVQAGGPDFDYGTGIALDGAGNAYLSGYFYGTATFGSQSLVASGGESDADIFVAKLDPDGNWLWAVTAGGTEDDAGFRIAVDGSGNACLVGMFKNTATFGSQTLTASGDFDVFVAKLDPSGNWLWAAGAGGIHPDSGYGTALEDSGVVYVTGLFMGTATFGSHTLTASADDTNTDIFVARLDPSGNWLWAARAGGTDHDAGFNIVTDGSGNAWVTGVFSRTATFGSHSLTAGGYYDVFVAKLNPSGNWLWAARAGGTEFDDSYGYGIALDGSDNACVTGYFNGTANFGSHSLITNGHRDIFVARIENITPVEDDLAPQVVARLHNAYPNPLDRGGSALIKTQIPEHSTGTLSIFNLRGQIVSRHKLGSGSRQISFSGDGLPAGVYFYSLQCGDYKETKKLVLLK
jgi:hypothetical protein